VPLVNAPSSTGRKGHSAALALIGSLCLALALTQAPPERPGSSTRLRPEEQSRTTEESSSPTGRFILGDYGTPLYRTDNPAAVPVVDAPATVQALQAAHVNTYAYLIYPGPTADPRVSRAQLQQLPDFARRAGAVDIDVFVYLVPPTEAAAQAYQPFGWDYVAWFDHIGRLAAQIPSIKGIILDDFGGNVASRPSLGFHFTPGYVERMTAAARRHAPRLSFLPVLYHHDLIGRYAVLSGFRHLVQGVVFPYFGYSDGRRVRGNTRDATKAYVHGLEASDVLRCPSPSGCRQVVFPGRTGEDRTTDTATFTSAVVPLPDQRRVLTLEVNDDAGALARNSYRVQVVVDGTPVSTVNRGTGWKRRVFDITDATADTSSAVVQLRVVRPAGAPRDAVTVQLSTTSAQGMTTDGGFAQPAATSPGVTSTPVTDLPLIYMPYAIPLSAERGQGASPAYFASVLEQMDALRRQGRIEGSLVFKLPLAASVLGTPTAHYEILARTYAEWSAR
jgi:hypothetical protein